MDGTKDRKDIECISIASRYVLDGEMVESVLGMEACTDLSAKGITDTILNSLKSYGIQIEKLLCQCYDGAFVMSGHVGGVQTFLQQKLNRCIPYIHCFSHRLHLVVIQAIKQIPLIGIFFDQITMLYNFFKKYKVRELYVGKSLQKLITTRWEGHLKATAAVDANFPEIVKCLRDIIENTDQRRGLDGEDIATAVGLSTCISKPEFVHVMVFMRELLKTLRPAEKALQSRKIGYIAAVSIIENTNTHIRNMRSDKRYEVTRIYIFFPQFHCC